MLTKIGNTQHVISLHTTHTKDVFHPVNMDTETCSSLFFELGKLFHKEFPTSDYPSEHDIVVFEKAPFKVYVESDEEGWPCCAIFGTDIHNIAYPMILLGVASAGIYLRILQHGFFFKEPVPAQCSEIMHEILLKYCIHPLC